LRIEDTALTAAQATFRTAGNQLAPVARTLPGLNADVAGADPLIAKLQDAQERSVQSFRPLLAIGVT
jgi:hypothetical protein